MTRPARLKGIPASLGVAVGPARIIGRGQRRFSHRRIEDVDAELARFEDAVSRSRDEIELAKQELSERHGTAYASILDVYLLMHGDVLLIDAILDMIRDERTNAEWALSRVSQRLKKPLLENPSSYFRERAQDIEHVEEHLLRHLRGERRSEPPTTGTAVLIARDLSPADAVRLLAPPTAALVTELGAESSHTSILARTFGVPAVVGVGPAPLEIEDDEIVIVDGFSGEVIIGPLEEEIRAAEKRRDRFLAFLEAERSTTAVSRDGVSVLVMANVELPSEVDAALDNGAQGIGLYRTEFMCLDRKEPPPEDAQVSAYAKVVETMEPRRVVFRTFDWRGDKRLRVHDLDQRKRGWLKTQIRAVLRASAKGSVSLMFPMVSTVEELREARALVAECRHELNDEGSALAPIPVGMMVEVPAAALLADRFAKHADFFAIGTNDLAHYTLAFDRRDHRAAVKPYEPAVLALIQRAVAAANDAELPCSMCGDMAADPVGLALALGFGHRQVSVPVSVLPLVRSVVHKLDLQAAAEVAAEALQCTSADAVRELVVERLGQELGTPWNGPGSA